MEQYCYGCKHLYKTLNNKDYACRLQPRLIIGSEEDGDKPKRCEKYEEIEAK